jgi:hypothetical protein
MKTVFFSIALNPISLSHKQKANHIAKPNGADYLSIWSNNNLA